MPLRCYAVFCHAIFAIYLAATLLRHAFAPFFATPFDYFAMPPFASLVTLRFSSMPMIFHAAYDAAMIISRYAIADFFFFLIFIFTLFCRFVFHYFSFNAAAAPTY